MGSFDLSDVKETFVRDVAQLLETLHRATSTLEQPLQQLDQALGQQLGNHPLQAIANSAHAVQGTSELLGIKPMGDVARTMQDLAQQGLATMQAFRQQMGSLSAIVAHCEQGTKALQQILSHELRQEREQSSQLAQAWLASAPQADLHVQGQLPLPRLPQPPSQAEAAAHNPAATPFGQDTAPATAASVPSHGEGNDLANALNSAFDRSQNQWLDPKQSASPNAPGSSAVAPTQAPAAVAAAEGGFSFFQDELSTPAAPPLSAEVSASEPSLPAKLDQAMELLEPHQAPSLPLPQLENIQHEAPAQQRMQRYEVQRVAEPELVEVIEQECQTLLEQWTPLVLSLESKEHAATALPELLRICHTLKGSIFTLGLQPTGQLLHLVEDFLEHSNAEQLRTIAKPLVHLLLEVHAEVKSNVQQSEQGFVLSSHTTLAHRLGEMQPFSAVSRVADASGLQPLVAEQPQAALAVLANSSVATADSMEDLLQEEGSYGKTMLQISIGQLDAMLNLAGELVVSRSGLFQRLGSLLRLRQGLALSRERLSQMLGELRTHLEFQALDGRSADSKRAQHSSEGSAASAAEAHAKPTALAPAAAASVTAFGALELDIYDASHVVARRLMELVDDISQLHATLFEELLAMEASAESFAGLIGGVQSQIMRARMVPVESLFLRLQLPIRDAGTKANRRCRVVTEGSNVLLDKGMADKLYAPMLHLVRNAVAHGLESEAERLEAGKVAEGTIRLSAKQTSGMTVLEVSDDGAGLNLPALRSLGIARGLLPPNVLLEDPSVAEMVFVTGLSTANQVSALSGRGVGCDVVKQVVERMQGQVHVRTVPGKGTTFVIHVPFTLAISRSLLLLSEQRLFAVPLVFCDRIIEAEEARILQSADRVRLQLGEDVLPVVNLPAILQLSKSGSVDEAGLLEKAVVASKKPFLLLRVGEQRIAVQVDEVAGQEDVLVKELGPILQGHPHFSGVTIRADGSLVLILDVASIVEQVMGQQMANSLATPEQLAESKPRLAARASVDGEHNPLAGKRILFVDDSLSVRKVADMALSKMGVEVTLAVDGLEGLEKLRSQVFDLVFTDLEMPRMHGYDFLSEIRLLSAFRNLPVVVVTSRSQQKHQDHAKRLGANDYITKPFTADTLQSTLERLLLAGDGV